MLRMDYAFTRVLMVDDDPEDRYTRRLKQALETEGRFTIYVNPLETDVDPIRQQSHHADLIVLDWKLADEGNFAIRLIREVFWEIGIPIVIFTGEDVEDVRAILMQEKLWDPTLFRLIEKENASTAITEITRHISGSGNLSLALGYLWKPALDMGVRQAIRRLRIWDATTLRILAYGLQEDGDDLNSGLTSIFQAVLNEEFVNSMDLTKLDVIIQQLRATPAHPATPMADVAATKEAPENIQLTLTDAEIATAYPDAVKVRQTLMYRPDLNRYSIDTGDIIERQRPDGTFEYGIVITPRCTLAQNGRDKLKVVLGTDLASRFTAQNKGQTPSSDKAWMDWLSKTPPAREYRLYDIPGCTHSQVCFDFNDVVTWSETEVKEGRKARLLSPFIEDLMQAYVRFQSRVGLPTLPFDKDSVLKKYRAKQLQATAFPTQ